MKTGMKRILITLIIIFILWWLVSLLTGYVVVINNSVYKSKNKLEYTKGDTIKPFKDFDFNKGNWKAYLVINIYDFRDLNKLINKTTCLKTTDINLLNKMKRDWQFIYTNGDVATVTSRARQAF